MPMETTSEADFEYDESMESGELFEASDGEDLEAGEQDETVEADYEFAAETDESDESEVSDGESLEAALETDEGVESADEAAARVSVSAGVRGDRNRARRWAGQLAADQRREAQRAVATQQDIARRIRAIPSVPKARTYSIGRLQGAGVVTAILPNGRRTQMRLMPAPAPINEVNKLREVINHNDRRQASAIVANTRAISTLATAQATAVKKLTVDQVKSDRDLAKRIVEGDTRLDKRITMELTTSQGTLGKQQKRMMRMLRRQRQRSLWNGILLTSAMPLFAAYGERSNPFSRTNLMLTGSLAGWLLGDELLDQFMQAPGKAGKTTSGIANVWSYAAPFGNAATAYFLLNEKQHERFVTGIESFAANATQEAANFTIGKKSLEEFKTASATIPVVATLVSGGDAATIVTALVQDGKLKITVAGAGAGALPVKVAWMVDTRPATS